MSVYRKKAIIFSVELKQVVPSGHMLFFKSKEFWSLSVIKLLTCWTRRNLWDSWPSPRRTPPPPRRKWRARHYVQVTGTGLRSCYVGRLQLYLTGVLWYPRCRYADLGTIKGNVVCSHVVINFPTGGKSFFSFSQPECTSSQKRFKL